MKKFKIKKDEKKIIRIEKSGKYVVDLVGQGAEVEVVGRFRGRGKEEIEIDIEVNHRAERTTANTHIRGVVEGEARARVNGTIKVFEGAQQTNSFLTEKVLILSDKARAEAIPNLEIEADEVKCSHAATVGKLDAEQMFYLMSRGLRQSEAKDMIVEGFLAAVS